MKPVQQMLAGLVLLLVVSQTHAENRTVLVQVKLDKDKKTSIAIHSDEKKEQKSAISVGDAVKVIGDMKGWGSQVGVYIASDRSVPAVDAKKLLVAVSDNPWLYLEYFGHEVPKVVADRFLKAAQGPHLPAQKSEERKEALLGRWVSDDADRIPVEFGADGAMEIGLHLLDWKWQRAKGAYVLRDDGKVTYTANLGGLTVRGHYTMNDGALIGPTGLNSAARWKKMSKGPKSSGASLPVPQPRNPEKPDTPENRKALRTVVSERKREKVEQDAPAPTHKASDVVLIANWLCGSDPARAFAKPFGDSKCLTGSKDPLLYTDIAGVKTPADLKAVHYEFVQARMQRIKRGHEASPAVVIVRSSLDEPDKEAIDQEKREPGGRVYYVEVAIGNLAWHWLRVIVRDEGEKPTAKILCHRVS